MRVLQIGNRLTQLVRVNQGLPGRPGVAGIINLAASFSLPANAAETEVILESGSAELLNIGDIFYVILPGSIQCKIRRDLTGYFLKSLIKLSVPTLFAANTKIFIQGDINFYVVAADVTIAVSGPTAVITEPNQLAVGAEVLATLGGIAGTLSRDITATYFTPKDTLGAPYSAIAYVTTIVIGGSGVSTNPLKIGNIELREAADNTLVVQGKLALYDRLSTLFGLDQDSDWEFVINDALSGLIAFGIDDQGAVSFRQLRDDFLFGEVEFQKNADIDYIGAIGAIGQEGGNIAFGVRRYDGAVEIQKLAIGEAEIQALYYDSDYVLPVTDSEGNIATAYRKTDGSFIISKAEILSHSNEIQYAPQVTPGATGTILYTKVIDGLQQIFIYTKSTAIERQITFFGNNVQPFYDSASGKILFCSDRSGSVAPHQMDLDGANQQDIIWASEAAKIDRYMFWYNGQSNSVSDEGVVGKDGYPATYLDSTVPAGTANLKLFDSTGNYVLTTPNAATLSLVSLIEIHKTFGGGAYPLNSGGAGLPSAIGNQLSASVGNSHVSVVVSTGQGGTGYSTWGPSGAGNSYEAGLYEARAAKQLSTAAGKTIEMAVAIIIAGENDANRPIANYKADHYTYFDRVQADFKPIFNQTRPIPLLITQQCCFGSTTAPNGTQAQFEAARDHPMIYCADPSYQYRYAPTSAGGTSVHLNGWSHRRRGIKLAQVAEAVYRNRQSWPGLSPIKVRHDSANNKVIVTMFVPRPPLRFDPWLTVSAAIAGGAWAAGQGYELADAANIPITINSANIVGNTVELAIPSGSKPKYCRYAMSTASVANGSYVWGDRSSTERRCGSLCDSDPLQGYDKEILTCNVTNGSATVGIAAGGFDRRGWYDRVTGASLAAGAIVLNRNSDTQLTLSNLWTGSTGTADLTFWYDQSNYCQNFVVPVNYK